MARLPHMSSTEHVFDPDAFSDLPDAGPGVASGSPPGERELELALRPRDLSEFVGQEALLDNLRIHLFAVL